MAAYSCIVLFIMYFFLTADDATDQLSLTLLVSDATQFGKVFPSNIGIDFTEEQRTQIAQFLVNFSAINLQNVYFFN